MRLKLGLNTRSWLSTLARWAAELRNFEFCTLISESTEGQIPMYSEEDEEWIPTTLDTPSYADNISAGSANQTGSYAISDTYNRVLSFGTNGGLRLPVITDGNFVPEPIYVINLDTTDTLTVFPSTSEKIDNQAINLSVSIPSGMGRVFVPVSESDWASGLFTVTKTILEDLFLTGSLTLSTNNEAIILSEVDGTLRSVLWQDTEDQLWLNGTGQTAASSSPFESIVFGIDGVAQWYIDKDGVLHPSGTRNIGSVTNTVDSIYTYYLSADNQIVCGGTVQTVDAYVGADLTVIDDFTIPTDSLGTNIYLGTTAGTASAFTLTPSPAIRSLNEGLFFACLFHTDANASATLNINNKGARGIKRASPAGVTAIKAGEILEDQYCILQYDSTEDAFILYNTDAASRLQTFTPVWSCTSPMSFSTSPTTAAYYQQIGDMLYFTVIASAGTLTSSGAATSEVFFTIPAGITTTSGGGSCWVREGNGTRTNGEWLAITTNRIRIKKTDYTAFGLGANFELKIFGMALKT